MEAAQQITGNEPSPEDRLNAEMTENGTLLNAASEAKRLIEASIEEDDLDGGELEAAQKHLAELKRVIKTARMAHVSLLFVVMDFVSESRAKRNNRVVV